jgi:hypothetical protein
MNDKATGYAIASEECFDIAYRIVESRGGYDPEGDFAHITAAQVQATIGLGLRRARGG